MTAIEHFQAFSRPLGVELLLENIQNEVTESLNLLEIVRIGHFKRRGIRLDTGHAHIGGGTRGYCKVSWLSDPPIYTITTDRRTSTFGPEKGPLPGRRR